MNVSIRVMCLILIVVTSACTATRSLPMDQETPPAVRKGEEISVFMNDGSMHQMLVGKATETELIGSEAAPPYRRLVLPWSEVVEIKAERVSGLRTAGAVLAGIIIIPPYVALEVLADDDFCFGYC